MAEVGGIIGCCLLIGCCGACFMCGRGCKNDNSTQVREPAQQPTRIVVTPVVVSSTVHSPASAPDTPTAVASVPTGYIVMTDPVTGEQRMYAPVAPATPTAPLATDAPAASSETTFGISAQPTTPTTSTRDDLNMPLLKD